MTIYDKGLIRAMKAEYKASGYDVAATEQGILIQGNGWGVEVHHDAMPNSVKSLIVLHNGSLPEVGTAVHVRKDECAAQLLGSAVGTMEAIRATFSALACPRIKPTRLVMDGCQVWQAENNLQVFLVDPEDQQVLAGKAYLVTRAIYAKDWFGDVYVFTQPVPTADKSLMEHLAQMQWIPLNGE